jgi:hypothetical protein
MINAKASPTKVFFISMLTRDISLQDCILDLLDNSVDGIRDTYLGLGVRNDEDRSYAGHPVEIRFDEDEFSIRDTSGGIPLDIAVNYAFRFGRPEDAPDPTTGSIGIYGIGMKRAIFKMGKHVSLISSTGTESFELDLNIPAWSRDEFGEEEGGVSAEGVVETSAPSDARSDQNRGIEKDGREANWVFPLRNVKRGGTDVPVGTTIKISDLYPTIARDFKNPEFDTAVRRTISRDYAFILARGLQVSVNSKEIAGTMPALRESEALKPFRSTDETAGVRIEIQAGLTEPPPDDTSATGRYPNSDLYGWYLVCNDRVIVTADKGYLTGWGRKPVPTWHPQFGGFVGIVRFESDDPDKLPWKTTKRDVETSNAAYQAALPKMMLAAKQFVDYTNKRNLDRKRAKRLEKAAAKVPVATRVTKTTQSSFSAPALHGGGEVLISFPRPREEVDALGSALGMAGASPGEVGSRAFSYCFDREVAS